MPSLGMNQLGLAESRTPVHYSEEMDWSPTQAKQSKYRAFNDFGPPGRDKQGFNESPTNVDAGNFWFKVPPAPKPPLHKLMDASKPVIREKPAEKESVFFSGRNPIQPGENGKSAPKAKVAFAQPAFFADQAIATSSNDPRNTLVDLLNSSFTIGGNDDSGEESSSTGARERPIELRLNPVGKAETGSFVDVVLLSALVCAWGYVTSLEELPLYTRDMMLTTIGLAVFAACHMARPAILDLNAGKGPYGTLVGHMVICLCEVIGCSMLLLQVWGTTETAELGQFSAPGLFSLSAMLAHATAACFASRMA